MQFPAGQPLVFGIRSVPTGPRERLLRLFFTPLVVVAVTLGQMSWCEERVSDQGRFVPGSVLEWFVAPSKKLQPHARVLR